MEQIKIVCRIKGEYTDNFGNYTTYEYRVFDIDTMDRFIYLWNFELKRHPRAKQELIWEDNTVCGNIEHRSK